VEGTGGIAIGNLLAFYVIIKLMDAYRDFIGQLVTYITESHMAPSLSGAVGQKDTINRGGGASHSSATNAMTTRLKGLKERGKQAVEGRQEEEGRNKRIDGKARKIASKKGNASRTGEE
jgi:hypothetical protein